MARCADYVCRPSLRLQASDAGCNADPGCRRHRHGHGTMFCMNTGTPLAKVAAAAATYKRTKAAHDKAQAALVEAVVAALDAGERPADVSRASGWDREYNRRLKKRFDEGSSASESADESHV